jgi:hypothetical protein
MGNYLDFKFYVHLLDGKVGLFVWIEISSGFIVQSSRQINAQVYVKFYEV